jgi:hypothetical protein
MQGKGTFDRVVVWVDSSGSGDGISVCGAMKKAPFLARLRRLDRELWQHRADVGATGEPVNPKMGRRSLVGPANRVSYYI